MRILTHMGGDIADAIQAAAPDAEVVVAPLDGELPPDLSGEVLVATHRADNLIELCDRGVEWVHFFGTGVDGMPPEILEGRVVTCSRGAGSVPISEWVLAVMLAYEKRLPDAWVHQPPPHWKLDGARRAARPHAWSRRARRHRCKPSPRERPRSGWTSSPSGGPTRRARSRA